MSSLPPLIVSHYGRVWSCNDVESVGHHSSRECNGRGWGTDEEGGEQSDHIPLRSQAFPCSYKCSREHCREGVRKVVRRRHARSPTPFDISPIPYFCVLLIAFYEILKLQLIHIFMSPHFWLYEFFFISHLLSIKDACSASSYVPMTQEAWKVKFSSNAFVSKVICSILTF